MPVEVAPVSTAYPEDASKIFRLMLRSWQKIGSKEQDKGIFSYLCRSPKGKREIILKGQKYDKRIRKR